MNNIAQTQEINVPVLGMNCTNCVAHIETALMTLPGISGVHVDLQANQVSLNYDPALVDLIEIQRTIEQAGYTIPTQTVTLHVSGMRCVSCVAHVQGALQDLPGCISAEVSLSQGNAQVQFIEFPSENHPLQRVDERRVRQKRTTENILGNLC